MLSRMLKWTLSAVTLMILVGCGEDVPSLLEPEHPTPKTTQANGDVRPFYYYGDKKVYLIPDSGVVVFATSASAPGVEVVADLGQAGRSIGNVRRLLPIPGQYVADISPAEGPVATALAMQTLRDDARIAFMSPAYRTIGNGDLILLAYPASLSATHDVISVGAIDPRVGMKGCYSCSETPSDVSRRR